MRLNSGIRAASTMARYLLLVGDVGSHQQVTQADPAIDESTGAAVSSSTSSTSAITTSAPSAAQNAVAIWPPIPRAPPVTMAILPSSVPATRPPSIQRGFGVGEVLGDVLQGGQVKAVSFAR